MESMGEKKKEKNEIVAKKSQFSSQFSFLLAFVFNDNDGREAPPSRSLEPESGVAGGAEESAHLLSVPVLVVAGVAASAPVFASSVALASATSRLLSAPASWVVSVISTRL